MSGPTVDEESSSEDEWETYDCLDERTGRIERIRIKKEKEVDREED